MGNILGSLGGGSGGSGGLAGSFSGLGGQQCCDPVVDPITLVTVIGAIAGLSLWLRQAVIDFMITGGKKKRSLDWALEGIVLIKRKIPIKNCLDFKYCVTNCYQESQLWFQ